MFNAYKHIACLDLWILKYLVDCVYRPTRNAFALQSSQPELTIFLCDDFSEFMTQLCPVTNPLGIARISCIIRKPRFANDVTQRPELGVITNCDDDVTIAGGK